MNWRIEQKRESDLAIARLGGEVCREAFADLLKELSTLFCSRHAFFDLSAASLSTIKEDDINYWLGKAWAYEKDCLAYRAQKDGRTAILAPQDVNYGVARIWTALMECQRTPIPIEIFRTETDAMAWLLNGGG